MTKVIKLSQAGSETFPQYERDVLDAMIPYMISADGLQGPSQTLSQARAEAERIVQDAYNEGMQRGMEASQAKFREQVAASAEALGAVAQSMGEAHEAFLKSLGPQVAELALAIAARILHREAETDRGLILSTARAALERLVERERLVIRLNPRDEEAVRQHKLTLLEEFDGVQQTEVVADASVSLGGCVVESETMHVDGRLESQLQNILDTLLE